jgi:hypothetical protein
MMKKLIFIAIVCAFLAVPAWADLISFADNIAGVDGGAPKYGGTVNWSADDSTVNLNKQSYSLLGGDATVSAYVNGNPGLLSHRLTRGLGVYGGEPDEVDRTNVSGVEHINITFDTMPYYVHEIEVRSLFDTDTTGTNAEWAAIAFYKEAVLLQTAYLKGSEVLNTGDGDASWTGPSILVDKLVFYVPTKGELEGAGFNISGTYDPGLSEFAVAKLIVTPAPAALMLGMLGLSVAGVKLRKFA